MMISTDVGKTFVQVQHPFIIKTLNKVGLEGTYLNMIKAIYEKPTANVILNGEKPRAVPQGQEPDKDVHCQHFYSK